MEITKVKFFPIDRSSDTQPLVACSLTFDNVFMVHNIKVFKGNIVVMPQIQKNANGFTVTNATSRDLCHPIDKDFFEKIKETVIEGYYVYLATGNRCYEP